MHSFVGFDFHFESLLSVPCVGATLAVVVASTESVANEAAALVRVMYTETGIVPVISLSQAVEKKSFYSFPPPGVIPGVTLIRAGNADKAMNAAYRTVSGQASAGGQYHFYMETQVCAFVRVVLVNKYINNS
jgi:xanthine dehydrogenase/oxidase